jgi:DnaK suppressor protein
MASVTDDIRRLDEIDIELAAVDAALGRLSEGTYGTCERCGAALDRDLLSRSPLAARCPDHAV